MDTKQDWKGLDGAIAWHLIERQAENWNQVGEMMNEWLKANTPTKEWIGLTHEEISVEWFAVFDAEPGIGKNITNGVFDFANAIEAKLKKKNAF